DADMELALNGVLWGAFGTTGQRCTATSRLILHKDIHDSFVETLIARVQKLKVGDGSSAGTDIGPVINESQRKNIERYVEIGKNEGATCILGGKIPTDDVLQSGWFYQPTIFTGVTPEMTIAKEEIFGPVLSVLKCNSIEEGIEIANNVIYG